MKVLELEKTVRRLEGIIAADYKKRKDLEAQLQKVFNDMAAALQSHKVALRNQDSKLQVGALMWLH
jgi:hypothetical protein